ncbi:MAG: DNA repair exonuclease [Pseudomonadota bacterium]
MALTFIHTADWQIGKLFKRFPDEMSGRLQAARLDAIDRLGALARSRKARFVLVAGDVFDAEGLPLKVRLQPLKRMEAFGDVRWVLLPGNHDPAAAGGIWSKMSGHLPLNVSLADRAEPLEIDDDVVILPAPLRQRVSSHDPTAWMVACETARDVYRIGLAHGSVTGFGHGDDANALIDPMRAKSAELDYLALGDWHGAMRIDARTWYSGTPEPDRFSDNESGNALVVEIAAPKAEPKVETVRTAFFTWVAMSEALSDSAHLDGLRSRLDAAFPDGLTRALVRLDLTGGLDLSQMSDVRAWSAALDAELAYLAVRDDGLRVRGDLSAHPAFLGQSELLAAAQLLEGLVASSDEADDAGRSRQAQVGLQLLLDAVETAIEEEAA